MYIEVITLFPDMVRAVLDFGVIGRAIERDVLKLVTRDPRSYAEDRHRVVDDRPYGGGPGMVIKVEPLRTAINKAREAAPGGSPVVLLSAQGRRFDQAVAEEFAALPGLVLVAGRYEGVDERLVKSEIDRELSVGDFVLSGGEIAAMLVLDAVARFVPGVLGDEESARKDSFFNGLLDHPHYTRPAEIDGMTVPEVLLSGNHAAVERWRKKESLGRTWRRRPDLLDKMSLTVDERGLLDEYIAEHEADKTET